MNLSKIFLWFIGFYLIFSLAIFLAGVNETMRIESFSLVDNNIWGNYSYECEDPLKSTSDCKIFTNTTTTPYNDYEEFKNNYVFTNEPAILFLNFFGLLGLASLVLYSFKWGYNSEPFSLTDIFTKFNILLILIQPILSKLKIHFGKSKLEQVHGMLIKALDMLDNNKIQKSKQLYVKIKEKYNQLDVEDKKDVYDDILLLYTEIVSANKD